MARFRTPVVQDLARFRESYRETLNSGHSIIDRVVAYLVRSHGKGIRPTLTLLCARLGSDRVNESAIRAAVIVELLHEATLVHDDVVDEAPLRRGFPSLPARFKNKVAVLFGDYMLANVLTETLSSRDLRWLDILSETARRMARGELLQAARSRRLDITEADYLAMIGDKTAALFNACCRLGGLTGGLPDAMLEPLGVYGESLGIVFQIRDDLLDIFGDGPGLGKPVGGDLKQRKLTLPVIAAFNSAGSRETRRHRARIRRGIKRGEVKMVAEFVRKNGGEEYARRMMSEYARQAAGALAKLPESPVRALLSELLEYNLNRRR